MFSIAMKVMAVLCFIGALVGFGVQEWGARIELQKAESLTAGLGAVEQKATALQREIFTLRETLLHARERGGTTLAGVDGTVAIYAVSHWRELKPGQVLELAIVDLERMQARVQKQAIGEVGRSVTSVVRSSEFGFKAFPHASDGVVFWQDPETQISFACLAQAGNVFIIALPPAWFSTAAGISADSTAPGGVFAVVATDKPIFAKSIRDISGSLIGPLASGDSLALGRVQLEAQGWQSFLQGAAQFTNIEGTGNSKLKGGLGAAPVPDTNLRVVGLWASPAHKGLQILTVGSWLRAILLAGGLLLSVVLFYVAKRRVTREGLVTLAQSVAFVEEGRAPLTLLDAPLKGELEILRTSLAGSFARVGGRFRALQNEVFIAEKVLARALQLPALMALPSGIKGKHLGPLWMRTGAEVSFTHVRIHTEGSLPQNTILLCGDRQNGGFFACVVRAHPRVHELLASHLGVLLGPLQNTAEFQLAVDEICLRLHTAFEQDIGLPFEGLAIAYIIPEWEILVQAGDGLFSVVKTPEGSVLRLESAKLGPPPPKSQSDQEQLPLEVEAGSSAPLVPFDVARLVTLKVAQREDVKVAS